MATNYTLMMTSRSLLLRVRNIAHISCRANQNTNFIFNNFFFLSPAVYEIMWKKYCRAGQSKDDNTMRRMRNECWISKARNTHSEYVLLVTFPRQKWLRERACHIIRTYKRRFRIRGTCPPPSLFISLYTLTHG
jgi:hypothetical protein